MSSLRQTYSEVEAWSPVMIRMAVASSAFLLIALIGLVLDPRLITSVPAWLKPAKFASSALIYLVSLAFLVRDLPRTRLLRIASTWLAVVLVAEVVVIFVQAARGTTSHFNINSPLDVALFSAMGIGIATVWICSAILLILHWRTPASDRAMALALRLGLVLNILGAGVGWTMTQPRPAQLEALRRGERPFIAGSHTVGAPDGGATVPIIHWSADHGDLRVPHFFGMHALQLLPLLLLGVRRLRGRESAAADRTVIGIAATACAAVFFAALVQALSGHPLIPTPAA